MKKVTKSKTSPGYKIQPLYLRPRRCPRCGSQMDCYNMLMSEPKHYLFSCFECGAKMSMLEDGTTTWLTKL